MDSNTLLVLIIDGGLVLFFLYALYYSSQMSKKTTRPILIKEKKEDITAVKIKDYKPTFIKTSQEQEEIPIETVIETSYSLEKSLEPPSTIYTQHEPEDETTIEQRLRTINIIGIEGIGPVYAGRLNEINIFTVSDLLDRGANPSGRTQIAEGTDISPRLILKWVNHADLYRIKGIVEEYSDLLEEAGVDTIPELAKRNHENLFDRLVEINEEKNLVHALPSLENIYNWVEEAKKIPRKIQY